MQSIETYGEMWEHLKFFFVTMLFNYATWLPIAFVFAVGWVIGWSLRRTRFGNPLIGLYILGAALSFLFKSPGWDLLILAGIPFLLGVYIGKKK